jgi:hypothetical protein
VKIFWERVPPFIFTSLEVGCVPGSDGLVDLAVGVPEGFIQAKFIHTTTTTTTKGGRPSKLSNPNRNASAHVCSDGPLPLHLAGSHSKCIETSLDRRVTQNEFRMRAPRGDAAFAASTGTTRHCRPSTAVFGERCRFRIQMH